ncbi:MAG: DUF6350 family protein [Rhodoglobus sp.]
MNRRLTALFAAFEALLVVAIGVGIPLAPLTVLWGAQFGFGVDWATFWRASVDIWLVGHGVDVTVTLDPTTAAALGYPGAGEPFTITIAALGLGMLTLLLAVRAGRRVAETRFRALGQLVALGTFALLSFGVTFSSLHPLARPSLVQGTLLPTVVFAVGFVIGVRLTRREEADDAGSPIADWVAGWPSQARAIVGTALRAGTASAAVVVLAASVATSLAIAVSYAKIIALYESLHSEVVGGFTLTLGQLAFVPNAVIWTASWFVGPGFAIGTGSNVSALGTQLGPIPAIPLLGALPSGSYAFGFVGLLVPVMAAFLVGAVLGPGVRRRVDGRGVLLTGLATGVVGGVILGMLAWASSGAAGPGRLQHVGPDPWAVGGFAALELAVAATLGLYASLRRSSRNPAERASARL